MKQDRWHPSRMKRDLTTVLNVLDRVTEKNYLKALVIANNFFDRYKKIPHLFELLLDIKAAELIAAKLGKFGIDTGDLVNKWKKNDKKVKTGV